MQTINLCKRSQVITRYALIGLSLILSYLKLYEAHYLSNFDLSSATKLFCILQNSICFQKCLVCYLKTVRKNLSLVIQVIFFSKYKICLIHLFHLSLTGAVILTVTLQASGDCLSESPAIKTVIIKQLFPCSRYSVTFTKTYLQSFWQTFLMLNKIQGPVSIINWV